LIPTPSPPFWQSSSSPPLALPALPQQSCHHPAGLGSGLHAIGQREASLTLVVLLFTHLLDPSGAPLRTTGLRPRGSS
ncbi:hypothetical protein B296_00055231, partial [Ensete ventricosum]